MRVLVVETNLMWSVRLVNALTYLGHEPHVSSKPTEGDYALAIVNLGEPGVDWAERIAFLQAQGMKVIGHAGHKEKELHRVGEEAGCDYLATNSELTHKLAQVIEKVSGGAEQIRTAE